MGSSGSSDYEEPPQGPAPPANMIAPQGGSAPFSPHFINFLGDTNQPSTGLTPDMLSQINGMNGPPPGAPPAGGLTSGTDIEMNKLRDQLAALTAQQSQMRDPRRIQAQQQELARNDMRGGNGSAGGRGGSAGGGGWGGH